MPETNIDDLTDAGVSEVLEDLAPWAYDHLRPAEERPMLRDLVAVLDRASVDWPHTVLGLPLAPVPVYR